ncbi:helix-turn-helix domain-containing protein [Cohnella cellulosilytica]|uniref:Helix-turn-helix domain-containing protein n=1 Tax=Cohnella cellulosilytica TaxID=986710 RepID=A0ABW2F9P7_9BACL
MTESFGSKRIDSPLLFCLDQAERLVLAPEAAQDYGNSSDYCLLTVTKGKVWVASGEGNRQLSKGDSIVLSPSDPLRITAAADGCEGYRLSYRLVEPRGAGYRTTPPWEDCGKRPFRIKPFARLADELAELYRSLNGTTPMEQFKSQLLFQQMLYRVLDQYRSTDDEGTSLEAVNRSIAYLQTHYASDYTVTQLAGQVNISVRQYTRLFKRITGKTPIDYLNDFRINRSKELLLQTDDQLSRISSRIGIKDVHYFNRRFKQTVGCSPKEYVRKRQLDSKIVTMHYAGEMLALGMRPIGTLDVTLEQLQEDIAGIVSIGETEYRTSELLELKPDLIVASDFMSREQLTHLETLAPVIVVPWDTLPIERLKQIARVLGKQDEAQDWFDRYTRKKQAVQSWCKGRLKPDETAAVLRLDEQKVWVHASRFFPVFYDVIGFRPSTLMSLTTERNAENRRVEVPFDRLAEIEADRLYVVEGREKEFKRWLEELVHTKGWNELSAVRNKQVYVIRQKGVSNNASSLEWQLDQVEQLLGDSSAEPRAGGFFAGNIRNVRKQGQSIPD